MVLLIRGNDAAVGVEIAGETTYGVDPLGGYVRVHPLLEESLSVERQPFPRSKELGGGTGALGSYDAGRQLVRGSFTVYPVYNSAWWAKLMAHAHGGVEQVAANKLPNGGTPGATASAATTHYWAPQSFRSGAMTATPTLPTYGTASGVAPGLSIRVWKAGTAAGSTTTVEVFSGCLISSWRWEQPEDDRPRCVFTFIGRTVAPFACGVTAGQLRLRALPRFATTTATSGGDTAWTNPASFLLSDNALATATANTAGVNLGTFGMVFPATLATVTGIQVIIEAQCNTPSAQTLTVSLSNDGGSTWESGTYATPVLSNTSTTYYLGGSDAALWGKAGGWTPAEIAATNFRVRVRATGTGTNWAVDSVRVQVFGSVTALSAPDPNQVEVRMRDFYNNLANTFVPGISILGGLSGTKGVVSRTPVTYNVRSFTFTFDGHLDAPPSFLTSIDTIDKPGHTENWEASCELGGLLEQTTWLQKSLFVGNSEVWVRLRYSSQVTAAGTAGDVVPYTLDLFIPRAAITAMDDTLSSDGVLPVRITLSAKLGEVQFAESAVALLAGEYLGVPWLVSTLDAQTTAYGL